MPLTGNRNVDRCIDQRFWFLLARSDQELARKRAKPVWRNPKLKLTLLRGNTLSA
jgi:hypothetical protein